jgi:hypothetical protein
MNRSVWVIVYTLLLAFKIWKRNQQAENLIPLLHEESDHATFTIGDIISISVDRVAMNKLNISNFENIYELFYDVESLMQILYEIIYTQSFYPHSYSVVCSFRFAEIIWAGGKAGEKSSEKFCKGKSHQSNDFRH